MISKIFMLFILLLSVVYSYGQNRISQKNALEDIDSLIGTIERVHYNPYLKTAKKDFDKKVTTIRNSIKGDMDFKSYLLKVNQITSIYDDGHTMPYIIQPELIVELKGLNFLPLKYVFLEKDIFLSNTNGPDIKIPASAKLISINGINLMNAFKQYQALFGGSSIFRTEMAGRLFNYYLFLKGVQPPFRVKYSANNSIETVRIDTAINFTQMLYNTMPHLNQPNSFRIIGDSIGCINFLSMNGDLNEWGQLLDSAFATFRQKNIRKLIIDIRNNSGGNSLYANYLLAYMTKKKFRLAGGKCWRVSNDKKKSLIAEGSDNAEYQKRKNGSLWCYEDCMPQDNPVIADTVFDGKIFLLTGPFTFSSANMLADAFKTFKLGTIVGEPTGEYTNDFGETLLFTLPNSKIKIQTTTSFEFGADCDKMTFHTVLPDIEVKQNSKDRLANFDRVFDFVINNINGS